MISIVCATNNRKILEEQLKKSLDIQEYKDYELIIIDTTKNKFESAADALNSCINRVSGEYILFTHHDVVMRKKDDLEKIVKNIKKLDDFGIAGVIGRDINGNFVGNITNGEPEVKVADNDIKMSQEVQTLDEVIFIIKKETLKKYPLETTNKTWHLYAVEYCLKMRELNKKVYVIPCEIYHKSAGASMNKSYYNELKRLCKMYKKNIKIINTTMGIWHTNEILLEIDIIKIKIILKIMKIKRKLLRNI